MKSLKRFLGYALLSLILPCAEKGLFSQQRPLPRHTAYEIGPYNLPLIPALKVTEYSQPFIYSLWWAEIADCEGAPMPTPAQMASVQFFSIPASLFTLDDRNSVALATTADWEPSIYVGQPYVWEEGIIKHEMLHMILRWSGYILGNYHPPELFERPDCGIHIYATPHR